MNRKSRLMKVVFAYFLLGMSAVMMCSKVAFAVQGLPDFFQISVGQTVDFKSNLAVIKSTDERLLDYQDGQFKANEVGETQVLFNLFGFLPIQRMNVSITHQVTLMPGGQAVGVALQAGGVLVVGLSDVKGQNPAQNAGIMPGDLLLSINGKTIENSQSLLHLVSSTKGAAFLLKYERQGVIKTTSVTPVFKDHAYFIGVWVRDSTAGVGTLSYYDMKSKGFGALGHAISDPDTRSIMPVLMGHLFLADITDVKKGARGTPGELRGSFLKDKIQIGTIKNNQKNGIYGTMSSPLQNPFYKNGLPICLKDGIKKGKATILSTVQGHKMQEYEIQIVNVLRYSFHNNKNMVIEVTDERLLQQTGGIVQGMSGSPIIQNGRIVGAVTHVFVDDPTRGYGIFIENMLKSN